MTLSFRPILLAALTVLTALSLNSKAQAAANSVTELDPFAPNVEQTLRQFDEIYQNETGLSPFLQMDSDSVAPSCSRATCPIWARVVKSTQTLYLYVNGEIADQWLVSTGIPGRETPNFDRHPDGRVYTRYMSAKYPGGDYDGLGNMPYAVFIQGGFALHGTPPGNWSKLGRKASHGCVRQHPDNAAYFNQLVRQNGVANVWITVQP